MTGVDVEAIRARADAATAGPWAIEPVCYCQKYDDAMETGGCQHQTLEWALRVPGRAECISYQAGIVHGSVGQSTAEFIAAARSDVVALLAALATAERRNAAMLNGQCPEDCDNDCDIPCHEAHQIPRKRQHDVETCPGSLHARAEAAEAQIAAVQKIADATHTFGGSDLEGWVNLAQLRRALGLPHRSGHTANFNVARRHSEGTGDDQ